MRNSLSLIWWLAVVVVLELVSLILDSYHYLVWGRLGIWLLKGGYLFFAVILFIRFLSFRSQRLFEAMVESYNRLAEQPWDLGSGGSGPLPKFLFHLALIALASSDLLCTLRWRQGTFRTSLLLDTAIWALILIWIARSHRLKAMASKEKLKELLDLLRSRRRPAHIAAPDPATPAKRPFLLVVLPAAALALGLAVRRWERGPVTYRVDALKACLEATFKETSDDFYHGGRLGDSLPDRPCLSSRRGDIQTSQGVREGEPYLNVFEAEGSDFFGNGSRGDEGLEFIGGRFRKTAVR